MEPHVSQKFRRDVKLGEYAYIPDITGALEYGVVKMEQEFKKNGENKVENNVNMNLSKNK